MNNNTPPKEFDAHNATCIRCGMLALRDPWAHAERYGHRPQFRRDGQVWEFDTSRGVSVAKSTLNPYEALQARIDAELVHALSDPGTPGHPTTCRRSCCRLPEGR